MTLIGEPYGEAWRSAVDGAELTTIDGAGHLVNLEQPAALAEELTRFLADGG